MVEAPMIVDVVIMAHPKRDAAALRLADDLDARVIWDERNDEWDTGARAWAAVDRRAQWGCVIQDDALPVPGARRALSDALSCARHHGPVSFYLGTGRPRQRQVQRAVDAANAIGASWVELDSLLFGVAVAMPRAAIDPMLSDVADSGLPYDQRIARWWRSDGYAPARCRYSWPSIIDHDDDVPGLVRHRAAATRRVAHRVGTASTWNGPIAVG